MSNIVIDGGTITQTVASGGTGQKSIVLKTKDTYVLEDIQVDVSASAPAGTFANSVSSADESSYTENISDNTVIPAGGSLYLSGGWYPKQKITLGHLIPDFAEHGAGTDHILAGYKAFDEDGNILIGTITTQTPVFDGGDVSTTAELHYTAPSGSIEPTGSFIPGNGQGQHGDEYGITTQVPGGNARDGVDYLTIDARLSTTNNGSVYATSTANRSDVLYNGSVHYFVDKSDNTVALSAPSTNATNTSSTTTIVLDNIVTDDFNEYYIPIVTPQGSGGTVSKTGQNGTVTCTLDSVTLASSGKFTEVSSGGAGANYGVHSYTPTTQNPNPSGTDGTNYLKIQTSGSGGNATVSGTINVEYSRGSVKANGTYKGLVSMDTNTQLLGSDTGTLAANVNTTSTATITGGSYYYIDIVEPKGSAPSITPNSISNTLSFPDGAPSVNSYIKGTITPGSGSDSLGDEYGVTSVRPSGTNGTDYLTIEPGSTRTAGTLSGDATITFTRGAVNANNTYKGAVSMTTSTVLVAQATGQTITHSLSKTIIPDTTVGDNLYIPISTPSIDGGALTGNSSITITSTGSPINGVTPEVYLFSKSGNNPQGTTQVDSTYGVQTTAPTSGNWVVLDPSAGVDDVNISATINIGRAAIRVSGNAGLWNGTTQTISETSQTYTGSSDVQIPVNGGTSKYIPVVSPIANTPTFSSLINPTVTTTTSATKKVGSASPTTAPAGVITSATPPSDLTTYSAGYIVVLPGSSASRNGSITASATASINAGITQGGTSSAASNSSDIIPTVNNDNGAKTYIKIYDGSYSVS